MRHSKKNIKNEFGLSREVISLLQGAFGKFPKIEKVKIFGSRAMGNYSSGSDIDLSFFASGFSHDDLLCLHRKVEDLDLLYKIDLVEYNKIENTELTEHIDLMGEDFYCRATEKKPV